MEEETDSVKSNEEEPHRMASSIANPVDTKSMRNNLLQEIVGFNKKKQLKSIHDKDQDKKGTTTQESYVKDADSIKEDRKSIKSEKLLRSRDEHGSHFIEINKDLYCRAEICILFIIYSFF